MLARIHGHRPIDHQSRAAAPEWCPETQCSGLQGARTPGQMKRRGPRGLSNGTTGSTTTYWRRHPWLGALGPSGLPLLPKVLEPQPPVSMGCDACLSLASRPLPRAARRVLESQPPNIDSSMAFPCVPTHTTVLLHVALGIIRKGFQSHGH